ncbi:AAA family ATPase [Streptomyces sp. NPDC054834]
MLVTSVEIEAFRNIMNKQTMVVDPQVTCLIGKNESGKTTILKALHRLNPANNPDDFHVTTDYPRRHLSRDRRSKNLDTVAPLTAIFALEDADFDALEEVVGVRPPTGTYVKASRLYGVVSWPQRRVIPVQHARGGAGRGSPRTGSGRGGGPGQCGSASCRA